MKTLLISTATAVLILTASAAFAADDEHNPKGSSTSEATGKHQAAPPKGNPSQMGGKGAGKSMSQTGQAGRSGNPSSAGSGAGGTTHHERHTSGGTTGGTTSGGNAPSGNAPSGTGQQGNRPSGNAGTHHGDAQAAMKLPHFHKNMRAQHRFRIGSYRGPHGYHYRRWAFGMFLPEIYFAQDYWISDYSDYDLDDPPDGYVWVRYGPDALLIDEDTGAIVEVEYGVFY
jgi:Ni/Co efflux regulator RcnB